jgi:hypothetical protein
VEIPGLKKWSTGRINSPWQSRKSLCSRDYHRTLEPVFFSTIAKTPTRFAFRLMAKNIHPADRVNFGISFTKFGKDKVRRRRFIVLDNR